MQNIREDINFQPDTIFCRGALAMLLREVQMLQKRVDSFKDVTSNKNPASHQDEDSQKADSLDVELSYDMQLDEIDFDDYEEDHANNPDMEENDL